MHPADEQTTDMYLVDLLRALRKWRWQGLGLAILFSGMVVPIGLQFQKKYAYTVTFEIGRYITFRAETPVAEPIALREKILRQVIDQVVQENDAWLTYRNRFSVTYSEEAPFVTLNIYTHDDPTAEALVARMAEVVMAELAQSEQIYIGIIEKERLKAQELTEVFAHQLQADGNKQPDQLQYLKINELILNAQAKSVVPSKVVFGPDYVLLRKLSKMAIGMVAILFGTLAAFFAVIAIDFWSRNKSMIQSDQ